MWEGLRELIYLSPVLVLWAWCGGIVSRRAGFSRWWGLLMLLPPIGIAVIWVFAYAAWPNLPRMAGSRETLTN